MCQSCHCVSIREPFSVFIIRGRSGRILILNKFEVEDIEIIRFKFLINLRIWNIYSVHRFAGSSVDELLGVGHVSAFNQYMSVPLTAIAKAYRKGSLQLIHLSIPLYSHCL